MIASTKPRASSQHLSEWSTVARVTHTLTTLLEALRGGVWDVYERVSSPGGFFIQLQLEWYSGAVVVVEPVQSLRNTPNPHEVKVGRIALPDDFPVQQLQLVLKASRSSGADALKWDQVTLVPVQNKTQLASASTSIASGSAIRTLPNQGRIVVLNSSGLSGSHDVEIRGPIPVTLEPGLNLVHLQHIDNGSQSTNARTVSVGTSYSPRYYL